MQWPLISRAWEVRHAVHGQSKPLEAVEHGIRLSAANELDGFWYDTGAVVVASDFVGRTPSLILYGR